MNIETWIVLFSVVACVSGLLFGLYNYLSVAKIKMRKRRAESPKKKKPDLFASEKIADTERTLAEADYDKLVRAGDIISSSATVYLLQEYGVLTMFIVAFGFLIYVVFFCCFPLPTFHGQNIFNHHRSSSKGLYLHSG